jgi:hypothetical protein
MSLKKIKRAQVNQGKNSDGDAINDQHLLQLIPGGMAHAFVVSKLHDKQLALAGLGPEPEWQGEMPILPLDIAAEDHDSLSNLLAAFTNSFSTATWYMSMAQIEASLYDEIVEYLEAIAMRESNGSSKEKREAEVKLDGRVVAAKALARIAHSDNVRFRGIAASLKAKSATVSRIGGFLGDEAASENAGAIKNSTRGKSSGRSRGESIGSEHRRPRK